MTLILSNDDVEQLLTMPDCIAALEDAYVELAEGRGITRTRSDCIAPTSHSPEAVYGLKSMDGVLPKQRVSAIRINSDIVTNPTIGNVQRRVKVPAAPNDRYVGLVLLFSTDNGEPLAIFPDGVLQHIRVGATNGLGVKYMARENSKSVGLLGSGWQAETQLTAVCSVRDIDEIKCFSPNQENREAFSTRMSEVLDIEVRPVDHPEDAMNGVDIAMCGTNSIDPIFFKDWIEPGMHLSCIKKPEIDPEAIKAADKVAVHTHENTPQIVVAKGAHFQEESKGRAWNASKELDFTSFASLPDLITGRAKGRENDEEVTCFLNNLGLGYQFAAAGAVIYARAMEQGMGNALPTDWFTETVHP
ncbi:MAG: ornithine cyclodeaminase family protein [Rhodospirillales bacterium]|jgi:alanine dehydrogenase|nr:ornithine cyclodeaminase family protein [Rhodospirillales bacterium]MBT5076816.1 ornithine cyclodeaminase family protein [Rhodospirillales bacterium]MBT5113518.1 ornithine cyclodeaminase family protein [Rhodospirillales bacterium]MBT5673816.1 ornithine cyclodeaminase family protein [Rhodospirillales bacterium]MBT6186474.1 ornithine cyclodeaminase family protein [Rhodospirillales bacterium]